MRCNRSRNFSRIILSESKPMLIIAPGGATGNETTFYFDVLILSCRDLSAPGQEPIPVQSFLYCVRQKTASGCVVPKTVLIADDSASVRLSVRLLLQGRHKKLLVREAFDGMDAVEKAKKSKPDLILLDPKITSDCRCIYATKTRAVDSGSSA